MWLGIVIWVWDMLYVAGDCDMGVGHVWVWDMLYVAGGHLLNFPCTNYIDHHSSTTKLKSPVATLSRPIPSSHQIFWQINGSSTQEVKCKLLDNAACSLCHLHVHVHVQPATSVSVG